MNRGLDACKVLSSAGTSDNDCHLRSDSRYLGGLGSEGQWRQDGEDLLKENSIKLGALIGIDYRKTEQKMLAARSAGINSSRRKSCASAIRRERTSN
jgi:hypothetical protein